MWLQAKTRIGAIIRAGMFAGVSGILYATSTEVSHPPHLDFSTSAVVMLMVILGGDSYVLQGGESEGGKRFRGGRPVRPGRNLSCDSAVMAVGHGPRRGLIEQLNQETDIEIVEVGDCVRPRRILDAIHEGFKAARLV